MSREVGQASIALKLDGKNVRSQASSMEGQLSSVFSGMGRRLGGMLATALSVKAIVDFGKKCLELGSDLEEVQNVVDTTFGSMASAVNDWASNAITSIGISEKMAKEFSGFYGAMAKSAGFTSGEIYDMSTSLTQLAGDVASFYNLDPSEAYNKLKAVFTGETEGLKSIGVMMTQANLDQFALANGFGKTTAAMTEQEKIALRYQYVMSALSDASGDFARTSGSWANQVKVLKLQFEQLSATLGQTLIAVLTPVIQALNRFMTALVKAANTFKAFVYSLLGKKSDDMASGSGAVAGVLDDITDNAESASGAIGGVGDSTAAAANAIRRSLAGFDQINKLMDNTASSGGSGSGGGSSGDSSTLGDTSSALLSEAWDVAEEDGPLSKIAERLRGLKDIFVNGFWDGLGDTAVFDSIKQNLSDIKTKLAGIFSSDGVQEAVTNYTDSLARMFGTVSGSLASIGASIADNLTGGLSLYLDQHGDEVASWIETISNNGARINDSISSISKSIAKVFEAFRTPEGKQFTANMIDLFSSPVIKFSERLSDILADIAETLADMFGTGEGGKTVLTDIFGALNDGYPLFKKIFDFFVDGTIDLILAPLELLKGVLDGIMISIEGIETAIDRVKNIISNWDQIVNNIKTGMVNAANSVIDTLNDLISRITGPLSGTTFGEWLASKLGLDGLTDIQIPRIEIEATANVTSFKNKLESMPQITSKAILSAWERSSQWINGGDYWNSIGMKALFNNWGRSSQWINGGDYWNSIGMTAKFTSWKVANGIAYQGTFMTWGNADGGVYKNGRWLPVQTYASGGAPGSGQLFVAREAGPELVGTLGGHTAVMNNDQIVASVSAGVARAIAGIKFYAVDSATPHLAAIEPSVIRSEQHLAAIAAQEQNGGRGGLDRLESLLEQILVAVTTMDFDVKMDGASVKDRIVQLVNAHTKSTGVCEILV